MSGRLVLNTALLAITANVAFYYGGRQTFMPIGYVWVTAALLGILLLVLAAIIAAFNRTHPIPQAALSIRMSIASAIVCFAMLPAVPLLKHHQRTDLDAARERAAALIPALQAHFESTGLYPAQLEAVAGDAPLPWLLAEPNAYQSTGTGYVLQIRWPGNPYTAQERRHNETRWRITQ